MTIIEQLTELVRLQDLRIKELEIKISFIKDTVDSFIKQSDCSSCNNYLMSLKDEVVKIELS